MYKPREDSFLIKFHIKNYAMPAHHVLDIGTGSAILSKEAALYAKHVTAADINKKLISKLKKENKGNKKIQFIHSNLFSDIHGKFNLILFNPPYLPSQTIEHIEIDGGKNGTEIIEKFLKQAKNHLKAKGSILIICSSLNKNVANLFEKYGYQYRKLEQKKFFFEKIFLYELKIFSQNSKD